MAYYDLAANSTSTLLKDNLLGSPASAAASHIYAAGLNFNSLSLLEQWWAKWYLYVGDPVLATGIMSFLIHEIFYFGRCIPWMIIDRIPYFKKWKLQEEKMPTPAEQWKCLKLVLLTHFTVELPQIWGFHPMAEYFGMATHQVPFPKWTTIAYQVALFFVMEDAWHYWAHRTLHSFPVLYKRIHKLHHEFSAPFGLAAEYAHPAEILILGIGTVGGPILWCWLSGGNLHLFTMYIWIILRLFQAVDAHSGYDFPWSLQHWLPVWSGADHHDFHHMNFLGCYSTSFRWWDHYMGTDKSYKAYNKKKAAARAAGKGSMTPYVPGAEVREMLAKSE